MSNKPGRNDPCPCGSGKKYKRCCLPTDEAAARQRSQQALFDDDAFGDSEFDTDDEDEGFVDIEEDVPGNVLPPAGESFGYEYDFGSTTHLKIKVLGERMGRPGRSLVRLAVRNVPPVWPCAICGEPATLVCAYCVNDDGNPFVCASHRRDHLCGEDEGFLPVVNSPRMGVCGYVGES